MNDPGFASDAPGNEPDQFVEREDLGANGVHDEALIAMTGANHDFGHIFDEYRLQSEIAGPGDGKHRKPAEEPGDVVDEDVFRTEYHRRPDDSVGQSGVHDRLFQNGLAFEIGER